MNSRYGLLAEFRRPDELMNAARALHAAGYRRVHAYTPYPVEELAQALGYRGNRISVFAFIGGVVGGIGGYFLQWYAAVVDYPINYGGRPLHSWPAFIPVTFELTILGAALFTVIGMLVLNDLPRLHHPLFSVKEFDLASRNRFFLCVENNDPLFDNEGTLTALEQCKPCAVCQVPL